MSKGIFIPDITIDQFRNASLEAVEELLVSGEMRDMENMINLDEALEYCKRCADVTEKLMMDSLNVIKGEMNMNTIANCYQASNYFQQQNIFWRYDAPNMLKALADGTWKEHFEESEETEEEFLGF